jgi:hypothetical protein
MSVCLKTSALCVRRVPGGELSVYTLVMALFVMCADMACAEHVC